MDSEDHQVAAAARAQENAGEAVQDYYNVQEPWSSREPLVEMEGIVYALLACDAMWSTQQCYVTARRIEEGGD